MANHFIEICKYCGTVMSQCRCPSTDKTKLYGVCDKCKKEGKSE